MPDTAELLERAAQLRREADNVLQLIRLEDIVHPYSRLIATGSYFLDVMVYPDIDFYITTVSIEELFRIAGQLAQCAAIFQVVFERSTDASMPDGLYLKLRIKHGNWSRPWKIDIWSIEPDLIEKKMDPMWRFKRCMTDPLREQIMRYKSSIITAQGRTPMYSGYFIYKAFMDEGMTDSEQVTRYLVENGIDVRR
jgi:hypothetical protein